MATLRLTLAPSPFFSTLPTKPNLTKHFSLSPQPQPQRQRRHPLSLLVSGAYKVVIEHEGKATELEVDSDETILSKALESGLPIPYDCNLGVCMTCPAKLLSGTVDQSDGMLSDDVIERGYALLCASYPRSDCTFRTIPEDELLSLQLVTAND